MRRNLLWPSSRGGVSSLFVYSLIPHCWRPFLLVRGWSFYHLLQTSSTFPFRSCPQNTRFCASLSHCHSPRHSGRSAQAVKSMPVLTRSSKRTIIFGGVVVEPVVSKYFSPTRTTTRRTMTMLASSSSDDSSTPNSNKRIKIEAVAAKDNKNALVTPDDDASASDKSREEPWEKTTKKMATPAINNKRTPPPVPACSRSPPEGYEEIYQLVAELRSDRSAPVDSDGSEALPDRLLPPPEYRFQVLMPLILSSQTKDAVVGEAIRGMQQAGVLSVDKISEMSPETLNSYIRRVGFHNNKTKYIKQVVEILKKKYKSDIPPTAAEMMELPGVGPKMAFICENIAWGRQSGIGVDTHMHRLFNNLQWVCSKTPEQTRVQLEAWLPRDKWVDVNLLWVGFGQEIQQFKPKLLRKALDCSRPVEALRLLKRCGLDYSKEGKKLGMEEEIRSVLQKSKTIP